MYYVVQVKEYKIFKSDLLLIEQVDDLNKAVALRDALQGIHPDNHYEVLEKK